jgi:hypothetical protein
VLLQPMDTAVIKYMVMDKTRNDFIKGLGLQIQVAKATDMFSPALIH